MPIRFACNACGQKLSISTRQAGNQVTCPRCQKPTLVPKEEVPAPAKPPASAVAAAPQEATSPVPSTEPEVAPPPVVELGGPSGDDDMPAFLLYDTPQESPHASAYSGKLPDVFQRTITIPRYVIYAQGALLAVVAIVSLGLGMMIGGTMSGGPGAESTAAAGPFNIQGTITYGQNNRRLADEGALVAILPDTKDPGARVKPLGLRPSDPPGSDAARMAADQIRNMGGGLTYVDAKGNYQLQIPSGGKFFLLVISAHQRRGNEEVSVDDIRRIGRFFEGATDLLGESRFRFSNRTIKADARFNEVFDSP